MLAKTALVWNRKWNSWLWNEMATYVGTTVGEMNRMQKRQDGVDGMLSRYMWRIYLLCKFWMYLVIYPACTYFSPVFLMAWYCSLVQVWVNLWFTLYQICAIWWVVTCYSSYTTELSCIPYFLNYQLACVRMSARARTHARIHAHTHTKNIWEMNQL